MARVHNWQIGREMSYWYPEARPSKQFAAVFEEFRRVVHRGELLDGRQDVIFRGIIPQGANFLKFRVVRKLPQVPQAGILDNAAVLLGVRAHVDHPGQPVDQHAGAMAIQHILHAPQVLRIHRLFSGDDIE